MFFSDVKKEIDQTTNQSNNLITPANKSVTILCNYLLCSHYIFLIYMLH